MKFFQKKSGQKRSGKDVVDDFGERANELRERASNHFVSLFIKRLKNVRDVRNLVIEWGLLVMIVFLFSIVQAYWYGNSYMTSAYVSGGNFTEGDLGKVNSLNPLYASTESEKALARLLFANLVNPDASGNSKMELIRSIAHDEVGKQWTVVLRDNLKWSDGEPITADDVIFSVNLIKNPTAKTTVSTSFANVKTEKIDDLTVQFSLPSVYADFMDSLEFPVIPAHAFVDVEPALVYENAFSHKPITSGVFKFSGMQQATGAGSELQTFYLARNENYMLGESKVDTFTVKTYADEATLLEALNNTDVDATASFSGEVEVKSTVSRRDSLINGGAYVFFNLESDALSDVAVRQAIQMGVDMNAVRGDIDETRALSYPFLREQEPGLEYPELAAYDFEQAKAKLAEKFSYDKKGMLKDEAGELITLSLAVKDKAEIRGAAENLKKELEKLGFTIRLEIAESNVSAGMGGDFLSSVIQPRNYDILLYEVDLGVSADPFVYYSAAQATSNGWNLSNYRNSLVNDELVIAHTTLDESLKNAKLNAFLKQWVHDVPAIGVYRSQISYYYNVKTSVYSENNRLSDALDRFQDVRYWEVRREYVMATP